jgi:HSP20 family molecular chaperone IbpA
VDRQAHDLMMENVRSIYHLITGQELQTSEQGRPLPPVPGVEDLVTARFAELDAYARLLPPLATRLPPFAFVPLLDVIERERDYLVELAIPGVSRKEVRAEIVDGLLVISGVRTGPETVNGWGYRRAEIPRGPFRRVVPLPPDVPELSERNGDPLRVESQNGLIQIHLSKRPMSSVAKA